MSVLPAFLVVNKPAGITSHDVVDVVRAVTGVRKVGHTGTLDPFATGVLPLALGTATRLIQFLDESVKVYDATIRFGSATDTGDPTGQVVATADLPTATQAEVDAVLQGFLGDRMQVPPAYSAVKHKGKPLYHYARKGVDVEVKARPITIRGMKLLSYDNQTLGVRISCGRGTYARVLAQDIAVALGSEGHLEALSRAQSGPFLLEDAIDFPTIAKMVSDDADKSWQDILMVRGKKGERVQWRPRDDVRSDLAKRLCSPIRALAHLPIVDVPAADAERMRKGGSPPAAPTALSVGGRYLVVCGADVVAVAEADPRGPKALRVI
ncbi:MAG: tRNA pseudouridine(55) synthase TruB [Myxococcota bacterium]